jgi:hypothetical protein
MDSLRFDRLAVQLGRTTTRRRTGGFLMLLGLGAGLGSSPVAKAKKKKKKKKKPPTCTPICVGQACGDPDGCGGSCADGFCPDGQTCVNGACADDCPSPLERCASGCVALDTDSDCGECGVVCPDHASCTDGECRCNPGFGWCGAACIANDACCTNDVQGCADNRTCCLENERGVCRNTKTDETNCGGCGAAFACDSNQQCVDGVCQPICTPDCPAGRTCIEDPRTGGGTCTCTTREECQAEQNPGGDVCLFAKGNTGPKICRCNATAWYGSWEPERDVPCAPGEPCSNCCTDQYCREVFADKPGARNFICAVAPAESYWPRFCCQPNWEECTNSSTCCSGDCLPADRDEETGAQRYRCLCTPPGTSCATDLECCRGLCEVTVDAFGRKSGTCRCFPVEHPCTINAECCSGQCDATTEKCICERQPCDCSPPMARCTEDGECCRGVCRDTRLCA